MVDAPEILELAVAAVARQVAGPVDPGARRASNGCATKRSAVRSGAAAVAAREPVAADAELAGHADRHRLQLARRGCRALVFAIGRPIVSGPPCAADPVRSSTRSSSRSARTCSTARGRARRARRRARAAAPRRRRAPSAPGGPSTPRRAASATSSASPASRSRRARRGAPRAGAGRPAVVLGARTTRAPTTSGQLELEAGDVERERRHGDEHVLARRARGGRPSCQRKFTSARWRDLDALRRSRSSPTCR